MLDGFLNILKPPGMSSGDVVNYIRKRLPRGVRVGHGGTLDPDACGVLPVCVGNAVRLFDYIIDKEKTYLAQITLGVATDTQDSSGKVVSRRSAEGIGEAELRAVLPRFTGLIWQRPPAYSAVHKDGMRLYDLARAGADTAVEEREALVHALEYAGQTGPDTHLLRVTCGKGVYIRTLLNDIGEAIGCGAHMSMLVRERAGAFGIEESVTLDAVAPDTLEGLLLPMDTPLGRYPRADIEAEGRHFVKNGNPIRPEWLAIERAVAAGEVVRAYFEEEFVGMGEMREDGSMRFRAMLGRLE